MDRFKEQLSIDIKTVGRYEMNNDSVYFDRKKEDAQLYAVENFMH